MAGVSQARRRDRRQLPHTPSKPTLPQAQPHRVLTPRRVRVSPNAGATTEDALTVLMRGREVPEPPGMGMPPPCVEPFPDATTLLTMPRDDAVDLARVAVDSRAQRDVVSDGASTCE